MTYLAAVLEYLAAKVLKLAENAACNNTKARIVPYHLQLGAIQNDEEWVTLILTFAEFYVSNTQYSVPHIALEL